MILATMPSFQILVHEIMTFFSEFYIGYLSENVVEIWLQLQFSLKNPKSTYINFEQLSKIITT